MASTPAPSPEQETAPAETTTVNLTRPCKSALRALKSNWHLPSTGAVIERLARERVRVVEIIVSDGEYAALLSKVDAAAKSPNEVARRILAENGAFEMPEAVE